MPVPEFKVSATFLELYNEDIIDLVRPHPDYPQSCIYLRLGHHFLTTVAHSPSHPRRKPIYVRNISINDENMTSVQDPEFSLD